MLLFFLYFFHSNCHHCRFFRFLSELMEFNYITSALLTVGFLADLTQWYIHVCLFVSSLSMCSCTLMCRDHTYVLGLVCQDQRQAPRVCEVFPSCIAPCLGSPRPLIIPTLSLISLLLSLSCAHALVSCFSFHVCFSPALCDLSVYVWPFCRCAPANDGTGIAGVLH